jgi:alpha-mannosidase
VALGVCCRAFDVVERRIAPWPGWRNPTDAQPQQAFVDLSDGQRGLMIANRGLPEYEVLRDGHGTLALTLLRCVGHLGDWGVFATTVAQCPGPWAAEYAILPHTGTWSEAARWAREYVTPLHAGQAWPNMAPTAQRGAGLPDEASFLRIEGEALVLAACKQAEDRASIVVRLYNPTGDPCRGTLTSLLPLAGAYLVTLEECRLRPLPVSERSSIAFTAGPKAIVTLELEPAASMPGSCGREE